MNCLFIGYYFHQKTLSSQFFLQFLETKYKIEYLWTSPFEASIKIENNLDVLNKKYDVIFMWQILLPPTLLQQFTTQNIILIPMYDNDLSITYSMWREFNNYKFLLFSKSLYDKLSFLGNENLLYLQYAPKKIKIEKKKKSTKKIKLFFWQRKAYMDFEFIKKTIDLKEVDTIHIHRMGTTLPLPSKKDIKKYNITTSTWFASKADFYEKLIWCDIFIAPRFYEGIGMSFLEAMRLGKCVVAANLPTMNEYIQDGYNGLLFDPIEPKRVDITNYKQIGKNAKKSIKEIATKWHKTAKKELFEFIDQELIISITTKINLTQTNKELYFFEEDINNCYPKVRQSYLFNWYLKTMHIFLKELVKKESHVILYGSGTGAILICGIIQKNITFIVDQDSKKHNTTLFDIPIYSIEKLQSSSQKIIISVFDRAEKIKDILIKEHKIDKKRIITLDINGYGF